MTKNKKAFSVKQKCPHTDRCIDYKMNTFKHFWGAVGEEFERKVWRKFERILVWLPGDTSSL